MWDWLKCFFGFHDWKQEHIHSRWGDDYERRICRRCPRKQRSFKNYAKRGRREWFTDA